MLKTYCGSAVETCLIPETEMGTFVHACEGEMVCESINPKIPYFNAPMYLENKVSVALMVDVL